MCISDRDNVDLSAIGASGKPNAVPFKNANTDFYMTNPIARASNVMAECSKIGEGVDVQEAAE